MKVISGATDHNAEIAISRYLSGAHDRYGGRKARGEKRKNEDDVKNEEVKDAQSVAQNPTELQVCSENHLS